MYLRCDHCRHQESFPAAAQPAPPATDADRVANAEWLARRFHEHYERLAVACGYETRPESRVQWADVPGQNRTLMVATASAVLHEGPFLAALADAAKWRAQQVVGRIVGMDVVADPSVPPDEVRFVDAARAAESEE